MPSDQFDDIDTLHLFDRNSCLRCHQAGGALLICSQSDCPVSFHFNCLECKPYFDPSGNFFCPYCSYKQKKITESRQKVANAKKKKNQTPEPVQEHPNRNEPEVSDKNQTPEPVPEQANRNEPEVSEKNQTPEPVQEHANRNEPGVSEKNQTLEPVQEHVNRNELVQEQANRNEPEVSEKNETPEPVQEHANRNEPGVSDSKQRKEHNDKDKAKVLISISSDSETETIDPESNFISVEKGKDKRKIDAVGGGGGDVEVGEEPSSGALKLGKQNVDQNLHTEQYGRRRVFWTDQEEKKLKEGVLKFSTESDYIPWQEILEWGCNVFHKTRSNDNLKDKWKRMKAKEASRTS